MVDKKFNKVLTIVLVIILIAIVGVLIFWGKETLDKYNKNIGSRDAVEEFEQEIKRIKETNNSNLTPSEPQNTTDEDVKLDLGDTSNNGNLQTKKLNNRTKIAKQTYKGFAVAGVIEIPKISIKYPVLDRATLSSMEQSVGIAFGPGLNKVGNTVILGHNYRNRLFFSNLHKLANGDKIYITDTEGNRLSYTVYNMYETGADDFDYAVRDTRGKREISLQTCTDDVQKRLIVWAKEDE